MADDFDIIDQLGGAIAVASLCRVSRSAVCHWRKKGIPLARRIQLERELKRQGKSVPRGFIDRGMPA